MKPEIPNIREVRLGSFGVFDELLDLTQDVLESLGDPTSEDRIFVDLFPHGTLHYHFSNLIVARYLSIHTGKKLVGLTTSQPLFIRTVWNYAEIMRMADAFGIKEIIKLDRADPGAGELSPSLREDLASNIGDFAKNAEQSEMGCQYYGFEDRLRRRYLAANLDRANFETEWLKKEYLNQRAINGSLKKLKFRKGEFFICGHLEYDPYKSTALHCVRAGGNVIYNWALQPFTLKKFTSEDDILNQRVTQSKDIFDDTYAKLQSDPGTFDTLAQLYKTSLRRVRPTLIGDRSRQATGIGDAEDSQNVLIMAQAMSDGVHSYGPMLYTDFADWIKRSSDVLTDNYRRMCLRNHPMQNSYDQSDFIGGLAQKYAEAPGFTYSDGTDALDIGDFTLAVTTQGTPGIELPIDGVRTVNVGHSRYTGYGLVDEPQSQDEYEKLLLGSHALSEAEQRERYQRAALFGYLELFCYRGTSRLLPFGLSGQPSRQIRYMKDTMSLEAIFSDPLFAQVGRLASSDDAISLNAEGLNMFVRGTCRPSMNVAGTAEPSDWWKAETDPTSPAATAKTRTIQNIKEVLAVATQKKTDFEYANTIFEAFFDQPAPQAWLLGAYKCLGRPWGRGRLIRHAFNAWKEQTKNEISWGEFRKA
jgi:hypothetical protein